MKKKNYLKPDVKVHQLKPLSVICGSATTGTNANEAPGEEVDTQSGTNPWVWE